jgi:hypothetical protein
VLEEFIALSRWLKIAKTGHAENNRSAIEFSISGHLGRNGLAKRPEHLNGLRPISHPLFNQPEYRCFDEA